MDVVFVSLFVKKLSREKRYLIFAFSVILLYVLPLYILNEDAHIRVHDNLDSNIAWYKVLAESKVSAALKPSFRKSSTGCRGTLTERNGAALSGFTPCFLR